MSGSATLVRAIKTRLKTQGISYRNLGKLIGVSEPTVKRDLARGNFSLQRLDSICDVSLSTSQASLAVGGQVTLNWSSQNAASCTASGGSGSDGWSGSLSTAGQVMVTESASGDYAYAITCSGAPPAASAQVHVEFTGASTAGSTKSGGGGGVGPLSLLFLSLLAVRRVFDSKSKGGSAGHNCGGIFSWRSRFGSFTKIFLYS
jgi:hypothetical protein